VIQELLDRVTRWASERPDMRALALVGSHASNRARPDSDASGHWTISQGFSIREARHGTEASSGRARKTRAADARRWVSGWK
jgi:hypothetical protein